MPWRSKKKSKNAVRGCFGAAGKDPKKRAKCRKMAHEAKEWRNDPKRSYARGGKKKGRRKATRRRKRSSTR